MYHVVRHIGYPNLGFPCELFGETFERSEIEKSGDEDLTRLDIFRHLSKPDHT